MSAKKTHRRILHGIIFVLVLVSIQRLLSYREMPIDDVPTVVREELYCSENEWRLIQVRNFNNFQKLPIDATASIEQLSSDKSMMAITYMLEESWYLFIQNADGTSKDYPLSIWFTNIQTAAPLVLQGKLYLAVEMDYGKKVYEINKGVPVWLSNINVDHFSFQKGRWTVCNSILYYISPQEENPLCGDLISSETGAVINRNVEFVGTYGNELVWRKQFFPLLYKIMIGDGKKGRVIHTDFWLETDIRPNAFDISENGIIMMPILYSNYSDMDLYFVNIYTGEWNYLPQDIGFWNREKSVYTGVNFEFFETGG